MTRHFSTALVLAAFAWGAVANAQTAPASPSPQSTATPPAAPAEEERDDAVLNRSQPDFTLINLPTGLRMPLNGTALTSGQIAVIKRWIELGAPNN